MTLIGHLLLRQVTEHWRGHRPASATIERMRGGLEVPGGGGEEAEHLHRILATLVEDRGNAALLAAISDYAGYLELEGYGTEALLALGRVLGGLPQFESAVVAVDATLTVARLNVGLARWPQALKALGLAAAVGRADPVIERSITLLRAAASAGAGRHEAARELIASIASRSDEGVRGEALGVAWMTTGAALEGERLHLEAVQAYHRALDQVEEGASRRRVLVALGGLLRTLGAGFAARQAFTLALAGPIPLADQVAARVELLELAIGLGDRVAFERQRRELAVRQDQLPPAAAVEFLTRSAQGLDQFGQGGRADRLLLEAQALAERHELHEAWFRIERMRNRRRHGPLRQPQPLAVLPLPWEHPEIAHVAATLDRQVEALAGIA